MLMTAWKMLENRGATRFDTLENGSHGELVTTKFHSGTTQYIHTMCAKRAHLVCSVTGGSQRVVWQHPRIVNYIQRSPTELHAAPHP